MLTNVNVFGCGGVGSQLAYYLSKDTNITRISLIDFDIIEQKNLVRQMFLPDDVGQNKAKSLAAMLKQFSPEKEYFWFDRKIEGREDLVDFNINDPTFVCTDNVKSKKVISDYFWQKLLIGCDDGVVDFKSSFGDKSIWTLGEGYNSTQNFLSNLMAASIAYNLYCYGMFRSIDGQAIVELGKLTDKIVQKKLGKRGGEKTDDEPTIEEW